MRSTIKRVCWLLAAALMLGAMASILDPLGSFNALMPKDRASARVEHGLPNWLVPAMFELFELSPLRWSSRMRTTSKLAVVSIDRKNRSKRRH